jgi:hypothetical protein
VVCHGLAALSLSWALGGSCVADALAVSASAQVTSIPSIGRFADAWHSIRTLRDGVFDKRASAFDYSAYLSPFHFSTCQADWCAASAATLGGIHGLALTDTARFEAPMRWQSSFSIAGSRVWSKFVKFSRTGINVRLPLN